MPILLPTPAPTQPANEEPSYAWLLEYIVRDLTWNSVPSILALTPDGDLWAWGSNNHGFLGLGAAQFAPDPVIVLENVVEIHSGGGLNSLEYFLAIKSDGNLWGWGNNWAGQIGNGTTDTQRGPIKILDDIIYVSPGPNHIMAITSNGDLWIWGMNNNSQIGDGTWGQDRLTPLNIMTNVSQAAAGFLFSMALTRDGYLWSWGANWDGQLGNGTTIHLLEPRMIMGNISSFSISPFSASAIDMDGNLWIWGRIDALLIEGHVDSIDAIDPELIVIAEDGKLGDREVLVSPMMVVRPH